MSILIRIASRIQRVHRDQDGTSMTEFVIGLPVFLTLFVGILNLHSAGVNSVIVKGKAHEKMWRKAIDVQTAFNPGAAATPTSAAFAATAFHNETGGSALDYALDAGDGAAATLGLSGGIMANSFTRVKPIDYVENIGSADGLVTYDVNAEYLIAETDSVSNALMNDAIDYGSFSSITGNGVVGALNGVADFVGMRPTIAAGVRYGISGDFHRQDVSLIGMEDKVYEARSHVANPPRPTSRYITFAVVRLAMEKYDNYDTAIDFKWTPEFEGIEDFDTGEDRLREIEACQEANESLEDGEEAEDCGDEPEVGSREDQRRDDFWNRVGEPRGSFP